MTPGRLVLLATTHRVAPGLLSSNAWEILRAADLVRLGSSPAGHPLLPALLAAGIRVEVAGVGAGSDGAGSDGAGSDKARIAAASDDAAKSLVPVAQTARELMRAAESGLVVWVLAADGDPLLIDACASMLAGAASGTGLVLPEVELLPGSWDIPGARLLDLVAVMDRLRSPGGCPWDAEQTHTSLVEYLVEEAYEAVEAIETGDDAALREELGDVLLQVVFHSRLAEEHDVPWTIDDVAAGIVDKLIARHPHVFSDSEVDGADHVEANWLARKTKEKGRESVTDGIPNALPALVLASKLVSRSRGVDVEVVAPETLTTVSTALRSGEADLNEMADRERAYGELLLGLVVSARADGIDAEAALRSALRDYRRRVRTAEGVDPTSGES